MRIIVCILLCSTLSAQYDHTSVFPDLEDTELLEAVVENFRPDVVLELTEARDTLYRRIHLHDDSVRCVYSGLTKYLDLGLDPSQAMFGNGNNTDINLEHSYPRGKGADSGNALSDMHHLFPTRVPVNSARASEPFREVPDNSATAWYYKDETRSSPPADKRNLYAEDTSDGFEPREDFKGNVARAAFYFYTMYREQAEAADPDFFESQRLTLCDWHEQDPVDSLEWVRNGLIASYQGGHENPFILDCRLARLYCKDVSSACRTVTVEPELVPVSQSTIFYPNVVNRGDVVFLYKDLTPNEGVIQIINHLGETKEILDTSLLSLTIDLPSGMYVVLQLDKKGMLSAMQRIIVL